MQKFIQESVSKTPSSKAVFWIEVPKAPSDWLLTLVIIFIILLILRLFCTYDGKVWSYWAMHLSWGISMLLSIIVSSFLTRLGCGRYFPTWTRVIRMIFNGSTKGKSILLFLPAKMCNFDGNAVKFSVMSIFKWLHATKLSFLN